MMCFKNFHSFKCVSLSDSVLFISIEWKNLVGKIFFFLFQMPHQDEEDTQEETKDCLGEQRKDKF